MGMALSGTALGASGPSSDGTAARDQYNVVPPVVPDPSTSGGQTTPPPGASTGPAAAASPGPATTTPDQQQVEDSNDSGNNTPPDSGNEDNNTNGGGGGSNGRNGSHDHNGTRPNVESGSTPAATTVSSGDLPFTGWAVLPIVLIGLVVLLSGIALRRRSDVPRSA